MLEKPEPVRHCGPGIRARQSPHVGPPPPPGVIRHLVGPPQSSWLTISYCISDVRFEARVIWHIKKRPKPCDPSGGRESAWVRGENICWPWTWGTGRWRESKGSGGKNTWGRAKAGTVQEPCRKCVYTLGVFLNPSLSAIKPNLPRCFCWGVGTVTTAESIHGSSKVHRHLHPDFTDLGADALLLVCLLSIEKMNSDLSNAFGRSWEMPCAGKSASASPSEQTTGGVLLSCSAALFPTMALRRSLRVCLEDSALLCGTAYTCSFSVNNCINFIGSPSLNWLRFM